MENERGHCLGLSFLRVERGREKAEAVELGVRTIDPLRIVNTGGHVVADVSECFERVPSKLLNQPPPLNHPLPTPRIRKVPASSLNLTTHA